MRQSKRCFEKYDVEVLSLEGTYLRTDASRAVIRDGDETCSVEEYACRHFRRRGYSAVRVENDPIFALFGVLMWPVIQDPSDPRRRSVGVFDRRAVDAETKIVWTHRTSDFGKPEYGCLLAPSWRLGVCSGCAWRSCRAARVSCSRPPSC